MASVGRLDVALEANLSQFAGNMDKATSTVEKFGQSVKAATVIAGAAFAGLTAGIFKAVQASSNQLQAELQLENAFAATGKSLDVDRLKAYASALQNVTTFGDEVTLSAAATLARFGQTQDAVESLLPRVQDMAIAQGVDLKVATEAVGKALAGQTGALGRYAVALTDAEKKTLQTGAEQQKLNLILGALDKRFKGASLVIGTTAAGAMTQFGNATGDAVEELGKIFEEPVGDFFRVMTTNVNKAIKAFQDLSPETKELIANLALVATGISGVITVAGGLTIAFSAAGAAMFTAFLPVLGVVALVVAAIGGMILQIGLVKQAWDSNLGGMTAALLSFIDFQVNAWNAMVDAIKSAIGSIVGFFVEQGKAVASVLNKFLPEGTLAGLEAAVGLGGGGGAAKGGDAKADTKSFSDSLLASGKKAFQGIGATFKAGLEALGIDIPDFSDTIKKARDEVSGLADAAALANEAQLAALGQVGAPGEVGGGEAAALSVRAAFATAGDQFAAGVVEVGAMVKDIMLGSIQGVSGEIAEAAVQGFQAGGPIGAIIAVFATLASKLEAIQASTDIVNEDIGLLLESFNELFKPLTDLTSELSKNLRPLFKGLAAIFKPIGKIIGSVINAIKPVFVIFKVLGSIFKIFGAIIGIFAKVLGFILKGIGKVIEGIVFIFVKVFNFIIEILAKVADVFGKGASVRKLKVNMGDAAEATKRFTIEIIKSGKAASNEMTLAFRDGSKAVIASGDSNLEMAEKALKAAEGMVVVARGAITLEQAMVSQTQAALNSGDAIIEGAASFTRSMSKFSLDVQDGSDVLQEMGLTFSDGTRAVAKFTSSIADDFQTMVDGFIESGDTTETAFKKASAEFESLGLLTNTVNDAFEDLNEEVKKTTAALTNVPSGFKTALARFQATDAAILSPALEFGGIGDVGERGTEKGDTIAGSVFNIGTIQANDPEDLVRMMREEGEFERFAESGSSQEAGGSFSSDSKGA